MSEAQPSVAKPGLGLHRLLDVTIVLVVFGLLAAMLYNYLGVYFVFFGEQPKVTPAAIHTFKLLRDIAVAVWALGFLHAAIRRSRGAIISYLVTLVFTVVAIAVLAVPSLETSRHNSPSVPPPAPGYSPCYSGSNNCN